MTISALSTTEEDGGRPHPESGEGQHAGFRYVPALDGMRAFAGRGRPRVSRRCQLAARWLPRSRRLLRSLRIPDHLAAAVRSATQRAHPPRRLLDPAGAAASAGSVPRACHGGARHEVGAATGTYPSLRGDVFSTAFYVANWHFIAQGANYFAATGPPSPLTHTWSLAVEEQFYLVWPILVVGVLAAFRRIGAVFWLALLGVLASATETAVLFTHGASETRLYYGTDTRAQSILLGAALAAALAWCGQRGMLEAPRRAPAPRFSPARSGGIRPRCGPVDTPAGHPELPVRRRFSRRRARDGSGTGVGLRRPPNDPWPIPCVEAAGLAGVPSVTASISGTSRYSCGSMPPGRVSGAASSSACAWRSHWPWRRPRTTCSSSRCDAEASRVAGSAGW